MSEYTFKMPDLGEGTVEAEIVAWHTKPGDWVDEDKVIVEVMTDKAAVEVPAPVSGRVISITGDPGDKVAVGSPLIVLERAASAAEAQAAEKPIDGLAGAAGSMPETRRQRVMASPANRRRAREAGIDLERIEGSGPGGRILRGDLQKADSNGGGGRDDAERIKSLPLQPPPAAGVPSGVLLTQPGTTEIKVIGLRRVIAERMAEAKRTIPHFAYVEEVDVTELEALRLHLNGAIPAGRPSLTYLPLVVTGLARVLESFPQCNALYDAARATLVRHRSVHVGVATQSPDGLKVPVVRDAQALPLWELAAQIRNVTERARANKSSRDELTGSTITVTSLGKLGGIVSTPIVNSPEVAIVGLNKAVERPVVHQGAIAVRRIMNVSSSFDHRFVDGFDAAAMIQALKALLEHPAALFITR